MNKKSTDHGARARGVAGRMLAPGLFSPHAAAAATAACLSIWVHVWAPGQSWLDPVAFTCRSDTWQVALCCWGVAIANGISDDRRTHAAAAAFIGLSMQSKPPSTLNRHQFIHHHMNTGRWLVVRRRSGLGRH